VQQPQHLSTTIAVLTDVHFGNAPGNPRRRADIADILLLRAVQRMNRLIHPDVVVVLGDLVDDGDAAGSPERLAQLRTILDKLKSPYIAIPGNHDGDQEDFYRVFDRPARFVDLCGVRFLPFIDREEPGYNASRSVRDIDRFLQARADYDGPIVALQHVCLAPSGALDIPYNYTNADTIVEAMAKAGVILSLSGHHHAGAEPARNTTTTFVNAPGLCESPFPFLVITLDALGAHAQRHTLAMPEQLGLVDTHVHTQLAYCSENMDVEAAIRLARDFGLAGLGFSEHSGQLYFDAKRYWGGQAARDGISGALPEQNRMAAYLELKRRYEGDGVSFGLEADVDFHGGLVVDPKDRGHFRWIAGSVHKLPSLATTGLTLEALEREFLYAVEGLARHRIAILDHPFRIFRGAGFGPPERVFAPTAEILRRYGVAVEINFHHNQLPVAFIELCLEMGLKFSFGSDAHNLYEIGEFADHLGLLRNVGFTGDLTEVLYRPPL
jgi:histidinol phosphatase-like PHP family hydrolase/calcineurin-like phosphoesterase family protein